MNFLKGRLLFLTTVFLFPFYRENAVAISAKNIRKSSVQPSGTEWKSPELTAYHKADSKAWFFSFNNADEARKVLPEFSPYVVRLDGEWSFCWSLDSDHRPIGFQSPDYDITRWRRLELYPPTRKSGEDPEHADHSIRIYSFPDSPGNNPESLRNAASRPDSQEVVSFRKGFTIPPHWKDQRIHICFYGLNTFFYLWINGQYVGFSKNSQCAARFDITPFLRKGENTAAIEVYLKKNSSPEEILDVSHLPGKFHSVTIEAEPKVCIANLKTSCDSDDSFHDCILLVTPTVRNSSKKDLRNCKIRYSLFQNELYSDNNSPSPLLGDTIQEIGLLKKGEQIQKENRLSIIDARFWSAEAPWRYTLVAELMDAKGETLQTVSTCIGLRKSGLTDVPASMDEYDMGGRTFYLNSEPVKLKGVSRRGSDPESGICETNRNLVKEIMLMKQANINTVRTTDGYTPPFWYHLCDKYGLYVVCKAHTESPRYGYGNTASAQEAGRNALISRHKEMATFLYNQPSIILWSLADTDGTKETLQAVHDSLRAIDPYRPILHEKDNGISDISTHIPSSISLLKHLITGDKEVRYPCLLQEYNDSANNTPQYWEECWKLVNSNNRIQGGWSWNWMDAPVYIYDSTTAMRRPKGGKFYSRTPRNGHFDTNALLIYGWGRKALYYEAKHIFQDVRIGNIAAEKGYFSIQNKNYFTDLSRYSLHWSITGDEKEVQQGDMELPDIKPRHILTVRIPFNPLLLEKGKQHRVHLQFVLKEDMPWEKKGYVQAEETFLLSLP